MLKGYVVGSEKLVRRVQDMPGKIHGAVVTAVDRFVLDLASKVKAEKLSGQLLNVRTGRLRRSIHKELFDEGTTVRGIVGTNVEYARVHEYGYAGPETVRAHLRTITQAWGLPLKDGPRQVQVSEHTRQVNISEKAYLRSALREMEARFARDIERAARQGASS